MVEYETDKIIFGLYEPDGIQAKSGTSLKKRSKNLSAVPRDCGPTLKPFLLLISANVIYRMEVNKMMY